MISIRQLLEAKGSEVWSTSPDASVYEALQLLAEKYIGALMVLRDGELAGVVSERDYARKVVLHGKTSMKTPIKEIMTEEVITVGIGSTVEEAMALMADKRIRHLPVMEGEKIVGVVSIGDLVKAIMADQEFTIDQLEKYISGTRS
ncbi:MAG: CBS domain-containing protein [Chloroflexi bacterium]|nr:CBS domain-containing protein [Chloroflexota bacterium]